MGEDSIYRTDFLFDGIVIFTRSLSAFDPGVNHTCLPPQVKVERVLPTDIKGSRYITPRKRCWKVAMCTIDNLSCAFVLFKNGGTICYKTVLQAYREAVHLTLDSIAQTDTSNNIQVQRFNSYEKYQRGVLIYPDDFELFFDTFSVNLEHRIIAAFKDERITVCFMASRMGQAMQFQRSVPYIKNYMKSEKVVEALVHAAFDMSCPSKVLVFEKAAFRKLYGKPCQEYYPGCLTQHGNFYHYLDMREKLEPVEPSVVKVYSYLGKYICHNRKPHPFRDPKWTEKAFIYTFTSTPRALPTKIKTELIEDISMISKFLKSLRNSRNPGRLEIIYSVTKTSENSLDFIRMDATERLEKLIHGGVCKFFELADIEEILTELLLPCAKSLQKLLDNLMQGKVLSWLDVCNVTAAEAMVAQCFYGALVGKMRTEYPSFVREFITSLKDQSTNAYFLGNLPPDVQFTVEDMSTQLSGVDRIGEMSLRVFGQLQKGTFMQDPQKLASMVAMEAALAVTGQISDNPKDCLKLSAAIQGKCFRVVKAKTFTKLLFRGKIRPRLGLRSAIYSIKSVISEDQRKNVERLVTEALEKWMVRSSSFLGFVCQNTSYVVLPWNSVHQWHKKNVSILTRAFHKKFKSNLDPTDVLKKTLKLIWPNKNILRYEEITFEGLFKQVKLKLDGNYKTLEAVDPLFALNYVHVRFINKES